MPDRVSSAAYWISKSLCAICLVSRQMPSAFRGNFAFRPAFRQGLAARSTIIDVRSLIGLHPPPWMADVAQLVER